MTLKLDTPCIGVCSTVYGDKVCRGCKRHYDEVIDWLGYSVAQKQAVYDRLNTSMAIIVGQYLRVEDPAPLRTLLDRYAIRYRDEQDPLAWALYLLMFASNKIVDLAQVGMVVQAPYQDLSLDELCNTIDRHLYRHSVEQQAAL